MNEFYLVLEFNAHEMKKKYFWLIKCSLPDIDIRKVLTACLCSFLLGINKTTIEKYSMSRQDVYNNSVSVKIIKLYHDPQSLNWCFCKNTQMK